MTLVTFGFDSLSISLPSEASFFGEGGGIFGWLKRVPYIERSILLDSRQMCNHAHFKHKNDEHKHIN